PILKLDEWDWQRTLDVNLKGTFFMSQLAGRVMAGILEKAPDDAQPRGGVILNVASTAGVDAPAVHRAAYAASMAGIVGFTRECAREFAAHDIRVHALCPAADSPPDPQTVANRVLFFCSPAAATLTGLVVRIPQPEEE
ncbi:MAG: SDR family oxidoreductase, partial [Anaerolineales bacterium]|nr:SDR family oxidoreductase [Anaerolineales bacterium]